MLQRLVKVHASAKAEAVPTAGYANGNANESTTIDQTQANRSIIPTGYKDTPQ